jgi:16S rRNA (adenine1518-N6/adenine1519-N6)-dimethyltransferase
LGERDLRDATVRTIRRYGITPSKRLGQNYVVDPKLISCILGAAELEDSDSVLEIGAGTGNLTSPIADSARKVIAVEKDARASRALSDLLSSRGNVEVVSGDIMTMELPKVDKIISNLPYSISTPITFKILLEGEFRLAALTYQREVASRLLAKPGGGDYSRLSVATTLLSEVERRGDFPPESFYPRPSVGSTVVSMRKRGHKPLDWGALDRTMKFLFSQRRRTLRKAIDTYSKVNGVDASRLFDGKLKGMIDSRVFELRPEDFVLISRQLRKLDRARGAK